MLTRWLISASWSVALDTEVLGTCVAAVEGARVLGKSSGGKLCSNLDCVGSLRFSGAPGSFNMSELSFGVRGAILVVSAFRSGCADECVGWARSAAGGDPRVPFCDDMFSDYMY